MKKLLFIPLMVVLVGTLLLCSCGDSTETDVTAELENRIAVLENEMVVLESGMANLEMKEAENNLLIIITPPLEWAGQPRYGTFYTPYLFARGAAESGLFTNITIYFGPEAAELTADGALEAMGAPMYPDHENMAEVSRYYKSELGITFVVPSGPIQQHEIVVADFITLIDDAQFAQIVANADRTVVY